MTGQTMTTRNYKDDFTARVSPVDVSGKPRSKPQPTNHNQLFQFIEHWNSLTKHLKQWNTF